MGERIAALLWRNSLTISSFAVRLGKDRAQVSRKMHGQARWYVDELADAAGILNTSVGFLMGETDDDRRPAHLESARKAPTASAVGAEGVGRAGLEPATDGL
ncbi:helix-turn-helix domain-containing protein [Leucobacter sp. USCH14]|uniref:helix-turn-helix domain-containing protein n=1 Tax=Leucobacter sp. USCH14 TaxID=3024838 RepID=UPI00403F2462